MSPTVSATKIGAAEIGLMTENREEKASRANCHAWREIVIGGPLSAAARHDVEFEAAANR